MRTARRRMGVGLLALGVVIWSVWLVWRVGPALQHPFSALLLVAEVVGLVGVVTTAVAVGRHRGPVPVLPDFLDRADRFRRAHAALVGHPACPVTRRSVAEAFGRVRTREVDATVRAGDLVTLDGVRRSVVVGLVAVSLLLGAAPVGRPPVPVLVALAVGVSACSVGTWVLSGGLLRPGDRLAWSFASVGLSVGGGEDDATSVVPLRWAGVVGAVAALNVTVALRGVSDRWTHGLPHMARDDRTAAMAVALVLVGGALVTMRRLAPPVVEAANPRRLEERTARRTALGATAIVGLVGLLAGIMTRTADADETPRPEPRTVAEQPVERAGP